jgi:hypothetical protein
MGHATTGATTDIYVWGALANAGTSAQTYYAVSQAPLATLATNKICTESAGISIQPAGTNISLRSAEITTTPWAQQGGGSSVAPTMTVNAAVAPDGTTTAEQMALPNVTVANSLSIMHPGNITVSSGTTYTASLYARGQSGSGTFYISVYDTAWTTSPCAYTASAWTRCSVTRTATATTMDILVGVDLRDAAQSAQNAQTFYIWGVQLEASGYATRYTATAGASATTNKDTITMASTVLGTSRGTIEVDVTPLWSTTAASYILDTRDGSGATGVGLYVETTALKFVADNGTPVASGALTWTPGTTYRIKAKWGGGTATLYRDGTSVASGSLTPTGHSTLRLGAKYDDSAQLGGNLKRLRVFR